VIAPELETKSGKKSRNPQIRLEQIAPREAEETNLLHWLSTYPRYQAKVAVIDGAHLLGEAAANALLKILEEPPKYARIILIAPSRTLVMPTLASRSTEIAFAPVPQAALHHLTTDPEVLAFGEGCVGKVRWALENPDSFNRLQSRVDGVLESLRAGPAHTLEALKLLNEFDQPWPYLAKRLKEQVGPEDPRYKHILESLSRATDALEAYVSEDLVLTWLATAL
jgi:DNA polymerase III subunit delta'